MTEDGYFYLGRPDFPETSIVPHYLGLLRPDQPNVLTIHAEIEGMQKLYLFEQLLTESKRTGVTFATMEELAHRLLQDREAVPVCVVEEGTVDGRSGFLATQRIAA